MLVKLSNWTKRSQHKSERCKSGDVKVKANKRMHIAHANDLSDQIEQLLTLQERNVVTDKNHR